MTRTLVYAVHSAKLFGTERMALETLEGFRQEYRPILLCPAGPLTEVARKRDIEVVNYAGLPSLFWAVVRLLKRHRRPVWMTTSLKHALCLSLAGLFLRSRCVHLHLVHGGAADRDSYGRKKYMNRMRLLFVAVSPFVAEKLAAFGATPEKIRVAGNFMTKETRASIRRGGPLGKGSRTRGIVISRLIPSKRVDLLLDALEQNPDLGDFSFDIFGIGGQRERLRQRAEAAGFEINLPGFSSDLNEKLGDYDFLVHCCPEEPFGLVILEAMAAGLPVLVPDRGGVTYVVRHGETGFVYEAGNPSALAAGLRRLRGLPEAELAEIITQADDALKTRFSCERQLARYRALIKESSQN